MTRFTFTVCAGCGVLSQPLIIDDEDPNIVFEKLESMGWSRLKGADYCPPCSRSLAHEATS
jgi:hypothetical protein